MSRATNMTKTWQFQWYAFVRNPTCKRKTAVMSDFEILTKNIKSMIRCICLLYHSNSWIKYISAYVKYKSNKHE